MRRTKRFSGIERGDELSELDNGELGEQKCTQKKDYAGTDEKVTN